MLVKQHLFQKYQNQRTQIGHGNEELMMKTKVGLKFLCQEFCSMILQRMTRVDTSKQGFRMEGWKSSDDSVVKWKEMDSIMALVLPMFDDPQLFLSTSLSTSSSSS